MNTKKYTAISLFSGMGGDTLGMTNAGIDVIAYCEYIKTFRETHDLNFKNCKLLGENVNSDISKISDNEFEIYKNKIDIIFSGFPCTSFSTAGKRLANDPRNTLFKEFVRATRIINPKIIVGENVKGLLTKKTESNELYINIIQKEFESLGYVLKLKIFACQKYGIPQVRERLIILGIRNDCLKEFNFEFPDEENTIIGLENIINFNMTGALSLPKQIYDLSNIPKDCILTDFNNDENEQNPHPYLKSKCDMVCKTYKDKSYNSLFSFSKRDSPIHCEIINIHKPSKTIICSYNHQPRLFVPMINKNGQYLRTLLPDELKQIQSFPKNYQIVGDVKNQITQIGNAVPPLLIEKIIKNILKIEKIQN
jgi:DNA (cytosine-5)-methyltransferase 1